MILVTVGTQLGFDRLVRAMDALAPELPAAVFIQTGPGTYAPQNCEAQANLSPGEFDALVDRASLIVSHAGIGSVLTAQRLAKPIVIVPRRAALGEHRNDHQLATASELRGRRGIIVALDDGDLREAIRLGLASGPAEDRAPESLECLKRAIRAFIATGKI